MKKTSIALPIVFYAAMSWCANEDDLNQPLHGKTFLAPRSQSVNAARDLAGWARFINLYCQELYGAVRITPSYGHSFRPERIAEYYFGIDTLVISGSQVTNRDSSYQLLADYFGLSPLFQSTVRLEPQIRTAQIDFDAYIGYGDYYIRAQVPAVWTRWAFNLYERISPQTVAQGTYPALYMASEPIPAPATSFVQAIAGNLTWGDVRQPFNFGIINGPHSRHGFAEAQVAIGWNCINLPLSHAGFNIRGSIPGGTASEARYLFEPIIGNGHHPELGLGFTSHLILWEKDGQQTIGIYADANITHLFNSRQRRSFDLINPSDPQNIFFRGFGTRYVLTKEFDAAGNYTGITVPTIDITTLECDVSVAVQIDAVIMASYIDPCYEVDLGYSVWLRSREMISNIEHIAPNRYALKGIQNVATPTGPSNATQSTATLFGNLFTDQAAVADTNPPVFFNDSSIDHTSAQATRGFTHKIFANCSTVWNPSDWCVTPSLGIGGEVEFEGLNPRHEIKANKNSISQWNVWIKGNFGF